MCKEKKIKIPTQLQVTPTQYGKEAESLLKQISKKPSNDSVQQIINKLEEKFKVK